MLANVDLDKRIMRFAFANSMVFSHCLFFIVPLVMLLVLALGALAVVLPICLALDSVGFI